MVPKACRVCVGESILYHKYVTDIHTVLEQTSVQRSPGDRGGLPTVGYKHLRASRRFSLPISSLITVVWARPKHGEHRNPVAVIAEELLRVCLVQ